MHTVRVWLPLLGARGGYSALYGRGIVDAQAAVAYPRD